MSPREIIKCHLDFTPAPRIGFGYSGGRQNDFRGGGIGPSPTWSQKRWTEGNFEYHDDEWGNVWFRVQHMSQGGEIFEPALKSWADLDNYELPALDAAERYGELARVCAETSEYFRAGFVPGFPFAICRYLRKMENYFQDLILERGYIDELHRRVTELLEGVIQRMGEAGVDAIFFCEDWGTQERLLVSPAMWRDIFKPIYKRLCGAAHDCGLYVMLHSCGYNWDILDDLAETGVNLFQFDQPRLYGLERLAEKLRQLRVCLYSPVDIQRILPKGNRDEIVQEAESMVKLFTVDQAGLIVKDYPDLPGIGVKPEWDQWAYDTFVKHQELPAQI